MRNWHKVFVLSIVIFWGFFIFSFNSVVRGEEQEPIAAVRISPDSIAFTPKETSQGVDLRLSEPDGKVSIYVYESGVTPVFYSRDLSDGLYIYELKFFATGTRTRGNSSVTVENGPSGLIQNGTFRVNRGSFVLPTEGEDVLAGDVVHADDVIITGSQCVGFDCLTDGTENFGFDTIKLKENNLRLFFDDTSTSVGFPANDWRIITNDSSSGGGNYFAIEDSTGAKKPFRINAGARTNAIYVSSTGRVGFGTATPVLNHHILYGDTPSIRLDQDTSSGWTAQVWDIAGNESNFFIRDTTGGSKLPFRIQPGTPTNTLTLKADGRVGIGTWSPGYPLELSTTGTDALIVATRTDGATSFMSATTTNARFGSITNHPVWILVNNEWKMKIKGNNSISMRNGATLTAGGVWTDSSSREYKEGIEALTTEEALDTFKGLNPVKFAYKENQSEKHVGFIAEEVPDLIATEDRKGLSPMDIVAVLTKVVQEQQESLKELKARNEMLEQRLLTLEDQGVAGK